MDPRKVGDWTPKVRGQRSRHYTLHYYDYGVPLERSCLGLLCYLKNTARVLFSYHLLPVVDDYQQ